MRLALRNLLHSETASVAPIVALSLFGIIAAGGIAFDYARLATMDTELQNAADQAALAAASQLDGQTGACARAAAAAAGLLQNETLFANDGEGIAVAIDITDESACDADGVIQFYQSYDKEADTFGTASTSDSNANVVLVQVNPRTAVYALTPVVGAFQSGPITAEAVASLGSAICKVPPVMMCNPAEPDNNTNLDLDFNPARGDGLRLVIGTPDAPGNFGFLRTEDSGAKEVAKMLGYDDPPYGCMGTNGVETEPGNMISVRAAFNTRFDITESGEMTCPDGGTCSPSINTRKDLVREAATPPGNCGFSSSGWREATLPYRPGDPVNPLPADGSADPEIMGYSRDICHAVSEDGACQPITGNVIQGDGKWDIDAFFRVNYPAWNTRSLWMSGTGLAATFAEADEVTRYDVYKWEMLNPPADQSVSGSLVGHSTPICRGAGVDPSAGTIPDRRRVSVAVVNCKAQNLKGHETNVQVKKWLDVFLVEPAVARGSGGDKRTRAGDIYIEVIEVTSASGDNVSGQPARRDVPYLIR